MTLRLILPALMLALCLAAAPAGAFVYAPLYPMVDQEVQFTDTSYDPDGQVVAWNWDFGDGGTSTEQHPTHVYTAPGVYPVAQTITDDAGISSYCDGSISVTAPCMCDVAIRRVTTNLRPQVGDDAFIVIPVTNRGPDTCCFELQLIHPWLGVIDSETVCLKRYRTGVVIFRHTYQPEDVGRMTWEVFAQPLDCGDPMLGNNAALRWVIVRP